MGGKNNSSKYSSYYAGFEPSMMSHPNIGMNGSSLSPQFSRNVPKKLNESRTMVNRVASILDENRVVLYKKGKSMGRGYYIVEVSSCETMMYITAFNVERP